MLKKKCVVLSNNGLKLMCGCMWPEFVTGRVLAPYFSSSFEINWPLRISRLLSFLVQCVLFRPEHSCDIMWVTKTCVVSLS